MSEPKFTYATVLRKHAYGNASTYAHTSFINLLEREMRKAQ